MRIVVISDSHGNKWNFYDVIDNEPTAEVFYFLGDGYREYEEIKDVYGGEKAFIGVLGNCDLGSDLPCRDIRTVSEHTYKRLFSAVNVLYFFILSVAVA